MPRTKLSRHEDAEKLVKGTIIKYMAIKDKTIAQCAKSSGMGISTLYRRLDHISDMTLDELARVRTDLAIPKDELWEALENVL